jgi:hypothetical protein
MIYCNESMARIKRKGDRGSPCLRPLLCLICAPFLPFSLTADEDDVTIRLIQFLHFGRKPFLCNNSNRYSQEMVSNAFVLYSLNMCFDTLIKSGSSILNLTTKWGAWRKTCSCGLTREAKLCTQQARHVITESEQLKKKQRTRIIPTENVVFDCRSEL